MNAKYPAKRFYDLDLNDNYDLDNNDLDNYDLDNNDLDNYEDLYRLVKDAYLDSIRSKVWD